MSELEGLANEYHLACRAMVNLWYALLGAYPNTNERTMAIKAHTEGRERCEAARKNLIEYASRGYSETGT